MGRMGKRAGGHIPSQQKQAPPPGIASTASACADRVGGVIYRERRLRVGAPRACASCVQCGSYGGRVGESGMFIDRVSKLGRRTRGGWGPG